MQTLCVGRLSDAPSRTRGRLAWVLGSLVLLGAACFVLYMAVVLRWVDCHAEAQSPCSSSSRNQIYASLGALVMSGAALFASVGTRGRPLVWLLMALGAYAVWGYLVDRTFHG